MQEEIWEDIVGYEGLYQVSSLGRIKSFNYLHHAGKVGYSFGTRQKTGYYNFGLYRNGIIKLLGVHRLVAKAFINNVNNKSVVNHINGNKSDNRSENLEWVTYRENYVHAVKTNLSKGRFKDTGMFQKPINQLTITGIIVHTFESLSEIQQKKGYSKANISKHLKGHPRYNTCYGFIWKYGECIKTP